MPFTPAQLQQQLAHLPPARCYWVAYSGGCDSHVLLHALNQLRTAGEQPFDQTELRALHVDHGLSPDAAIWATHCQQVCEALGVAVETLTVKVAAGEGESPEAAARDARYQAFAETLGDGDVLLLAHHRDDQAETLLLQLFRGSGPQGLSAMPACRPFHTGMLGRPLLEFSRSELCDYARENRLNWIDDPSNFDTSYDRNYLRQQILPRLKNRWPAIDVTLARAARHQSGVLQLTRQLAQRDWQHCRLDDPAQLAIAPLLELDPAEQTNLLRYWIKEINQLQVPDEQRLQRILGELISAAEDAQPQVEWGGIQLRRYQGRLYLVKKQSLQALVDTPYRWDLHTPVNLTADLQLFAEASPGEGLQAALQQSSVQIRFRRGGETCRPVGRGHRLSLKNLMQEWAIPPWQRPLLPLVYVDDEIAAVPGYCVCESFAAEKNQPGIKIMLKTIT